MWWMHLPSPLQEVPSLHFNLQILFDGHGWKPPAGTEHLIPEFLLLACNDKGPKRLDIRSGCAGTVPCPEDQAAPTYQAPGWAKSRGAR